MECLLNSSANSEIEKYKFHHLIYNRDANKIVVSNKISFGKKDFNYFIGYKDAKIIRPLCIFFPKMSVYRKDFDKTKCMSFLIKDEKFKKNLMKFGRKSAKVIEMIW